MLIVVITSFCAFMPYLMTSLSTATVIYDTFICNKYCLFLKT